MHFVTQELAHVRVFLGSLYLLFHTSFICKPKLNPDLTCNPDMQPFISLPMSDIMTNMHAMPIFYSGNNVRVTYTALNRPFWNECHLLLWLPILYGKKAIYFYVNPSGTILKTIRLPVRRSCVPCQKINFVTETS